MGSPPSPWAGRGPEPTPGEPARTRAAHPDSGWAAHRHRGQGIMQAAWQGCCIRRQDGSESSNAYSYSREQALQNLLVTGTLECHGNPRIFRECLEDGLPRRRAGDLQIQTRISATLAQAGAYTSLLSHRQARTQAYLSSPLPLT